MEEVGVAINMKMEALVARVEALLVVFQLLHLLEELLQKQLDLEMLVEALGVILQRAPLVRGVVEELEAQVLIRMITVYRLRVVLGWRILFRVFL
jgi:hypothetical protein